MKIRSSIISVVALMSAMSFALPAYAQDQPAQPAPTQPAPGGDAGAGAGAGGAAGGGADQGGAGGGAAGGGAAGGGAATPAPGGEAPAQGGAGGDVNVNITTEQQTEVRSAITELNVAPVASVDFDINVGVAVPQTIKLQPLPARVVTLLPQFAGYLFFLLPDGRIVIVAPTTLKIVYILAA